MNSESASNPARRKRSGLHRLHLWLRWLHMYFSMTSLIIVLFFALTGMTLNHPEWTFGIKDVQHVYHGTIAPGAISGDDVAWVKVVEQLRSEHAIRGAASDMRVDAGEGSVSFKGPGYDADCFFETSNGKYELTTRTQGFVGWVNDLHRGREAGKGWSLLIDLSGAVLAFIALTGLGIMCYLKKSRVPTFILCGLAIVGFAVMVAQASR